MVQNLLTLGVTVWFSCNMGTHDVLTEITASSYTWVMLLCEDSCENLEMKYKGLIKKTKTTTKSNT